MSSVSGFSGVYAVDWAQTAPGEEWGLDPAMLAVGMSWRWRGRARRLDAAVETLRLGQSLDRGNLRARARARMARLARGLAPMDPDLATADDPAAFLGAGMVLTDGHQVYPMRIVRGGGRLLAVFDPLLPSPDTELWITELALDDGCARRGGVICFLPGTLIDTPQGRRPVETLEPGDAVSTRDAGAQPVVWRGETRLTGAELYLHPDLRPVRIRAGALRGGRPDADLLVSPGHRLLLNSGEAPWSDREVLVRAADLEDGRAIRRDFTLSSVRYVHLMLESHQILTANGQPCESFHPGLTDERVLAWHARTLERVAPGLVSNPGRYGGPARRCLDRGEAAILAGMAGERRGSRPQPRPKTTYPA
ncbi:MAG: hypothetical protein Kow0013_01930 [Pararhodobacter sp.]